MSKRILYIEDEPAMARIVADTLRGQGFEVLHREDGNRILDILTSFDPDLCLFDVMLPGTDGFSLGTIVRNLYPSLPIMFITAKSQTTDVLSGFSAGGTDYIRKPFSIEELIVRISNQLRLSLHRRSEQRQPQTEIVLGSAVYSPMRLELNTETRIIKLSNREAEILNLLCAHRNQVIDRKKLLLTIWGDDSFFHSRNLDVYVRKLRDYFESNPDVEIITLKGKGYQFSVREH